jgi:Tfp pilus assembly protein PilN
VMLRTNLSTRPFYNVRAVNAVLGVLTLLVLALTAFNVVSVTRLRGSQQTLGARAQQAEAEATRLRGEAARIRAQIDPKELSVVSAAAAEANGIIDRRAFSWTQLFAHFEETLPDDVRITSVSPAVEKDGTFVVSIAVEAQQIEDLDAFVEALEASGTFHNVLPTAERTDEDDLIEAIIVGVYRAQPRDAATAPAAGEVPR